MWVFLTDAFLSIVADRDDPKSLLVRARRSGDIERVFPRAEVRRAEEADYRFGAFLPRGEVQSVICARIGEIRYPSFMDAVEERDRHNSYFRVWDAMYRFQSQAERE